MEHKKICCNCEKYYTYKTDEGRYHGCEDDRIYELFGTSTIMNDFGCIWFEANEDEIIE